MHSEIWNSSCKISALGSKEATQQYGTNTTGISKQIFGAVRPSSRADIIAVVKESVQNNIPLYPISTGRNWGYGSATPVKDGCIVVDLSGMNRVLDFDHEFGIVTVEPGVTQAILKQYLDDNKIPFMVPTTGGGAGCSLIGNALERGYGITHNSDNFAAVMSLEAILPNGEIYRSPLIEQGALVAGHLHKWGLGPYLDGIFSQSNFGIVVQMSIALKPIPEHTEAFFFDLHSDSEVVDVIKPLREILMRAGGMMGPIKISGHPQLLARMHGKELSPWMGFGGIYGDEKIVARVKEIIEQRIGPLVRALKFTTLDESPANPFLQLLTGSPSDFALALAYFKCELPTGKTDFTCLEQDGCGILWFAPLVPISANAVQSYLRVAKQILTQFNFEPAITLTSLSDRCFDSALAILFDTANTDDTARAHLCYRALFFACKELGFLPYRMPTAHMDLLEKDGPAARLAQSIKRAIDPNTIIAPGRYV